MRSTTLWARLLGLVKAVVEDVCFDDDGECIVVSVRPRKATKRRCGQCGKRCPGYDQGEGRRRWRALDLGTVNAFLEADSPRVRCAEHGVVAAQVPWARHGAGHTYAFDDTAAWLPLTHGLSNARVESGLNTKLRLLTRMAYGFRSTDNLIALCLLDRGGHCPPLPGRT